MTGRSLSQRRRIAGKIREWKDEVAREVVRRLARAHPGWWEALSETARGHCLADSIYHLEFLAGAVELGENGLFEDYARWLSRVLSTRGVGLNGVRQGLEWTGEELAARLEEEEIPAVLSPLRAGTALVREPGPEEPAPEREEGLGLTKSLFLQTVLRGDRQAAHRVAVEAIEAGHAILDIYVDVFQEALYEIGRLWERNVIPVAAEHMATATTQFVLAQMYSDLRRSEISRGRAVITGVEGEQHQVGSYMVADILEADGWDMRYLGANVPHAGILAALDEHEADLLGISVTMIANLPRVADLIRDVRDRRDVRVLVGGSAFRASNRAWKEVGADGFAPDLRTAAAAALG